MHKQITASQEFQVKYATKPSADNKSIPCPDSNPLNPASILNVVVVATTPRGIKNKGYNKPISTTPKKGNSIALFPALITIRGIAPNIESIILEPIVSPPCLHPNKSSIKPTNPIKTVINIKANISTRNPL